PRSYPDSTSSALPWSVPWPVYSASTCAGGVSSSGTAQLTGSTTNSGQASVGNNKWITPSTPVATGAAPIEFTFQYWSSSAASQTPLSNTCLAGPNPSPGTLYAHFKDTVKPVTTTRANNGGYGGGSWINTDVSLQLNATDNGTGVKSITYAATGAQPITQATVNNTPVSGAQSVTVPTLTTEGTTTVTYHATDNSKTANVENDKTFVAMIDKHNPTASITFP